MVPNLGQTGELGNDVRVSLLQVPKDAGNLFQILVLVIQEHDRGYQELYDDIKKIINLNYSQ